MVAVLKLDIKHIARSKRHLVSTPILWVTDKKHHAAPLLWKSTLHYEVLYGVGQALPVPPSRRKKPCKSRTYISVLYFCLQIVVRFLSARDAKVPKWTYLLTNKLTDANQQLSNHQSRRCTGQIKFTSLLSSWLLLGNDFSLQKVAHIGCPPSLPSPQPSFPATRSTLSLALFSSH